MRLGGILALAALWLTLAGSAAQTLDQQEQCGQQARQTFQELEAAFRAEAKTRVPEPKLFFAHQSHYNTKINRCLMLFERLTSTVWLDLWQVVENSAALMDANERRPYANWLSRQAVGDKAGEKIVVCRLVPGRGKEKDCSSRAEFDAFVASYMEE